MAAGAERQPVEVDAGRRSQRRGRRLHGRSLPPEQCVVEEAGHALLVFPRAGSEATHVPRFLDLPQCLRGGGGVVVVGVQLLAAAPAAGVDQEDRTRGDLRDEVGERGWRRSCRSRLRRRRSGRRPRGARTSRAVRGADAHERNARPRPRRRRRGARCWRRRPEHHLATHGEADAADAALVHVGPSLQPGDRSVDVLGPGPTEQVRVALASVVAARVDEEHAVAVADEHPRLLEPPLAGRKGDDGGAVARRDVPPGKTDAVARPIVTCSYAPPRFAGATSARGRCVASNPIATGMTSQYTASAARAHPGSPQVAEPARLARAPEQRRR